jgi:hypothetical protein
MCFLSEKNACNKNYIFLGFSCDLDTVCFFDKKKNEGRIKV